MKKTVSILGFACLATLVGCSGSSTADGGSSSSGNSTFNAASAALTTSITKVGDLLADTRRLSGNKMKNLNLSPRIPPTLNTLWTTDVMSHPMCSGGGTTHCTSPNDVVNFKDWMGYQLDPDAVRDNGSSINVFGRLNQSLQIGCAMMNALTVDSATGYPAVGTHTITFTSAVISLMASVCDMTDTPPEGTTFNVVITTPSDTTYFDMTATMTLPAGMGGATQTFMLRMDSAEINIMNVENGTYLSRTLVALNRTTNVLRVEYNSGSADYTQGQGGAEISRLFYDGGNNVAGITMVQYGVETNLSTNTKVAYTLAGNPNDSTAEAAFSASVEGYGITNGDFTTTYSSCVNEGTGALTMTAYPCGNAGAAETSDGSFATNLVGIMDTKIGANAMNYFTTGAKASETSVPTFTTLATMFTAAP